MGIEEDTKNLLFEAIRVIPIYGALRLARALETGRGTDGYSDRRGKNKR